MSIKWLQREGPQWVHEQIITQEQYEQIAHRYEGAVRPIGLLPLLGTLLLGLSILSFVAANWQQLPELLRISMLLVLMIGTYAAGQQQMEKGRTTLGICLVSIGLVAFGASIILIGQMFHMIAFSAVSLVIWALAGVALTYIFRSRFLAAISIVLLAAAQMYSVSAFHSYSYFAFAVLLFGLASFVWWRRDITITAFWSLSIVVHSMLFIVHQDWRFGWFFVPLALLYTAGDWLPSERQKLALQASPLAAAFLFSVVQVLFAAETSYDWNSDIRAEPAVFIPILAVLLVVSWLGKRRSKDASSLPEWIIFLPYLYVAPFWAIVLYLASMFVFSLYVLLRGYAEEEGLHIRFGTLLFLLSTMVAYFKLTWSFMDKSLFFFVGGILLLGLSWFLNRKNRKILSDKGEG